MKPEDTDKLFRLTEKLREISLRSDLTPLQLEALQKAGFALIDSFLSGKRDKIELHYHNPTLSELQKEYIKKLGINF